jgi:hypothetical protein
MAEEMFQVVGGLYDHVDGLCIDEAAAKTMIFDERLKHFVVGEFMP